MSVVSLTTPTLTGEPIASVICPWTVAGAVCPCRAPGATTIETTSAGTASMLCALIANVVFIAKTPLHGCRLGATLFLQP